jgi:hypothetical protein
MNPAGRSRGGITFRNRNLGLLIAMVVSAAPFFVTPTPATATPIEYSLSDATAMIPSPFNTTLTLTGTFTFDPSSTTLDAVDILITGSTSILPGGQATFDDPFSGLVAPDAFTACDGPCVIGAAAALTLLFTTSILPTGATLDAVFVGTFTGNGTGVAGVASESVTGDAIPTPIPEPASLTLLGGAIALFLFARRANRRVRHP